MNGYDDDKTNEVVLILIGLEVVENETKTNKVVYIYQVSY